MRVHNGWIFVRDFVEVEVRKFIHYPKKNKNDMNEMEYQVF